MRKYGKFEKLTEQPKSKAKQTEVKSVLLQTYFTSLMSLVLCVTMFFGTTYAWFTSEVTNTGNEIYIGTLDVELEKLTEVDGVEKYVSLSEMDSTTGNNVTQLFDKNIRWEPGYTALETIKITNEGDLAFNYVLDFTDGTFAGPEGSLQTLEAVADHFEVWVYKHAEGATFTPPVSYDAMGTENSGWTNVGTLKEVMGDTNVLSGAISAVRSTAVAQTETPATETAPTATEETYLTVQDCNPTAHTYTIALHMKKSAGNEVMGHKLTLNVKLTAYQMTSEKDAFGTDYDITVPVSDLAGLKSALTNANGATSVVLKNDIALTEKLDVAGDVSIILNGNKLDASSLTTERPFYLKDGANLIIEAEGSEVILGDYGLINIPGDVKNATITLNGGTYTGDMSDGALVRLREGNEKIDITLNNVTYVANKEVDDGNCKAFIVSANGFAGEGTLKVNGGRFAAYFGFDLWNLETEIIGAEIITQGTCVEAGKNSVVTVKNCTLKTNYVKVGGSLAAAIAASNNGNATVNDCTITGKMVAPYYVYNTGGTITVTQTTTADATYDTPYRHDLSGTGEIVIDGNKVA